MFVNDLPAIFKAVKIKLLQAKFVITVKKSFIYKLTKNNNYNWKSEDPLNPFSPAHEGNSAQVKIKIWKQVVDKLYLLCVMSVK